MKRRALADGLGRAVTTTYSVSNGHMAARDHAALIARLRQAAARSTLAGTIGSAVAAWRAVPAEEDPRPLSRGWYRDQILRRADYLLATPTTPTADLAVSLDFLLAEAARLGADIEDAAWRFRLGDAARCGLRVRAGSATGRSRRRARAEQARDTWRPDIVAEVRAYRRTHPAASVREIVRHLSRAGEWIDSATRRPFADRTLRRRVGQILLGHNPRS